MLGLRELKNNFLVNVNALKSMGKYFCGFTFVPWLYNDVQTTLRRVQERVHVSYVYAQK